MKKTHKSSYVVLDLSSLDGRPKRVWGPFASDFEADAFGMAHVGHWTIWPLTAPQNGHSETKEK